MGFGTLRAAFLLLVLGISSVLHPRTCGASGTISGSITDASTGLGFPVCAEVYDDQGGWVVNACPGDGVYTTPPLDPGIYYVATNNWMGYYDEVWDDILCNPMCDVTIGIQIVIASDPVTGIDFDLAPGGGWISGMLTDASTGNGVAFTPVFVYDSIGDQIGFGWVNPPGLYTSKGALETGTYFAVTSPDLFLGELYDDFPCPEANCDPTTGTPITVFAGSGTGGIDFFLLPVFIFGDGFEDGTTGAWQTSVP